MFPKNGLSCQLSLVPCLVTCSALFPILSSVPCPVRCPVLSCPPVPSCVLSLLSYPFLSCSLSCPLSCPVTCPALSSVLSCPLYFPACPVLFPALCPLSSVVSSVPPPRQGRSYQFVIPGRVVLSMSEGTKHQTRAASLGSYTPFWINRDC